MNYIDTLDELFEAVIEGKVLTEKQIVVILSLVDKAISDEKVFLKGVTNGR
jgi:hypothetical protein